MRIFSYLNRYADFVRDVATMMSGKAIAAAIALFTTPIVARLFEPGDFGVAAVFASIVGITSKIASLTYGTALVIPKLEDEAQALMAFSYQIVLLFCSVMLMSVAILEFSGAEIRALDLLGPWVWLLPFGTLLAAAINLQESWLTRCRSFGIISASLVAGNSIASGSRIAAGWTTGTSIYGLIVGQILGMVTRLLVQRGAGPAAVRATFGSLDFGAMRQLARQYADFPLLNAPAGLVFALGQNLPVLLFGSMFSPAAAGFYAMANRLSKAPVTIGAAAIRRVFLQKAATVRSSGRTLGRAFLLTIGGLAALGVIPCTCVWLFGEPILTWLLGSPWSVAGQYLEIIAPWMFMIWVMSPCNAVFIVLRRQSLWLTLQTTLTVLRLGAFGLGYSVDAGPEWTLGAFVVATIAGNLVTMLITVRLAVYDGKLQWNAGAD